jgi:UDP-N-acetylglucosamine 4,6-dehydratase
MTRFWITLEQGVEVVIKALEEAEGGEIFVPKLPSMKIVDLAKAIEPNCKFKNIGIRPGEKLHEVLISEDEVRKVKIFDGIYVIMPQFFETRSVHDKYEKFPSVEEDFIYRSDKNDEWLNTDKLRQMIKEFEI